MESLMTFDGHHKIKTLTTATGLPFIYEIIKVSIWMYSSLPFAMIDLVRLENYKFFFLFHSISLLAGERFFFYLLAVVFLYIFEGVMFVQLLIQCEMKGKKLKSISAKIFFFNNAYYKSALLYTTFHLRRVFTAYFLKFFEKYGRVLTTYIYTEDHAYERYKIIEFDDDCEYGAELN